jgi:2'-hydroxyisoflavone reductase
MRALVLGGTGWLGRAIVQDLLERGTEVTCLARGATGDVPDGARHVRTDRRAQGAYEPVRGAWDEVVELSSDPGLVRPALDALADSAAHWTLVSTVSVYARNDEPGADETAEVVEPVDLTQYADAKVAAERSSADRLGSRLLVARPGLIVGAGDPSDRFGYWPARLSRPGPVLAPTSAGRTVQVIDVTDLAAWVGGAARSGRAGVVNAVGEVLPMRDFLRLAVEVAGFDGELVEVEDDVLLAHDVQYWAGPRSLPLWLPHSDAALMHRSARAFRDAGGVSRPLSETLAGMLADERDRGVERPRRAGLEAGEEAEVLAAVR